MFIKVRLNCDIISCKHLSDAPNFEKTGTATLSADERSYLQAMLDGANARDMAALTNAGLGLNVSCDNNHGAVRFSL